MITSKADYILYLREDKRANINLDGTFWGGVIKYWAKAIIKTDDYRAYSVCKALRKYEYVLNCLPNNIIGKIYKGFFHFKFHRKCIQCNIFIRPNTVGYGLKIQHLIGGGARIGANKIGNYFSIRQYTTVGKANGDACPVIGNNVTLGANVTIIGDITIGDNCIIGAGAVVVKDIPANSIVVGNPGRIIGKKIAGKQY